MMDMVEIFFSGRVQLEEPGGFRGCPEPGLMEATGCLMRWGLNVIVEGIGRSPG
jgi:hypothetical protein